MSRSYAKSAAQLDCQLPGSKNGLVEIPGFPTVQSLREMLAEERANALKVERSVAPTAVLDALAPADWLQRAMSRKG